MIAKSRLTAQKPLKTVLKPKKRRYIPATQKTVTQLIKLADHWFSKYVRLRDCELRNGSQWWGKCITCKKLGMIAFIDDEGHVRFTRGWDNGHFISRGNYITRFEETNCNLQCLTEDSKLMLIDGSNKSIKDIADGDEVLAFDEKTLDNVSATVLANVAFLSRSLYKIVLEDGTIFHGTGDHRVLCDIDGEIEWKFVEDVYNMLHAGVVCNIITL